MLNDHSSWYIALVIASLMLLGFVYLKTHSIRSMLLFLGMAGVGYIIEFVIYVLLNSYWYDPQIITTDPYYDSNLGAVASNMFILPALATFIAAFELNWVWIIAITGFLVGIEWLFIELHIYGHYWWRLLYSALGFPLYFGLAKVWYRKIRPPMKRWVSALTLFLITGALLGSMQYMPIIFFNSRSYDIGWFQDPARDTTAFATVFWLWLSAIYVVSLRLHWKYEWMKYALPLTLMLVGEMLLMKAGILHMHVWWSRWYCLILCAVILLFASVIDKRLTSE